MRGEWSAARPGRTLPPGKTRYPFYRRLGGPQGRSARAENLVPTGIRSRIIQPVVSRYTDWATRPTFVPYAVPLRNYELCPHNILCTFLAINCDVISVNINHLLLLNGRAQLSVCAVRIESLYKAYVKFSVAICPALFYLCLDVKKQVGLSCDASNLYV